MKKAEIIERLEKLNRLLNLSSEEYAAYHNSRYSEFSTIKATDAYATRTGEVRAEIEWILKN